jgi:hypothetical protein
MNVLPGVVVMQTLIMGVTSLYQVMSHKRSALLTQIWAYPYQNGRMQVVFARVTNHLIYYNTSDLYLLGLATGTLTTESIANLMCCAFAFSYSFVNLAKARSRDQKLDRHFRLTWGSDANLHCNCRVEQSSRASPKSVSFTDPENVLGFDVAVDMTSALEMRKPSHHLRRDRSDHPLQHDAVVLWQLRKQLIERSQGTELEHDT